MSPQGDPDSIAQIAAKRIIRKLQAENAQLRQQRDEYKTLAGIGVWHKDCRPNREMAARELQKSQAVIDKLADTISDLTKQRDELLRENQQLRAACYMPLAGVETPPK